LLEETDARHWARHLDSDREAPNSEALGFSKRLESLTAATAIRVAVYNFCRMHSTLKATPAMAAGVNDRLWRMHDLYDAVEKHSAGKKYGRKPDARIARLISKLKEN
jgi:hypothetical protein